MRFEVDLLKRGARSLSIRAKLKTSLLRSTLRGKIRDNLVLLLLSRGQYHLPLRLWQLSYRIPLAVELFAITLPNLLENSTAACTRFILTTIGKYAVQNFILASSAKILTAKQL